MNQTIQDLKQQAAEHAVKLIESGMIVGLGTGSTAILAVQRLAQLLEQGQLQNIVGVPTSIGIEQEAQRLGIPLATLAEHPTIDLTIDGADEVDPLLDVIKGGGGALLREKIVAQATRRQVIIVDETKLSPELGTQWAIPIEVISFGWESQYHFLEELGAEVTQRMNGDVPFLTDHKNYILDANFGPISDPYELARQLNGRVGIVEHGLFLSMVTDVIVASSEGIQHAQKDES